MNKHFITFSIIILMLCTVIGLSADYYDSVIGLTGSALKNGLHTIIHSSHTQTYSYSNLENQLKITDEDPNNSNNVIEIYTGWSVPKSTYGGGVTQWNKEHTWSKSHGNFGDNIPAGTDLHHMRPCDATVNSFKGNRDFDWGTTSYTDPSPPSGYTGATGCKYSTTYIFEPRDADKGDVARMLFYMAVRYDGGDTSYDLELVDYVNSASSNNRPYYGKLSTLLAWHFADPPDAWEALRNNRIQNLQGNRNPFIDHPEFVARIWGGTSNDDNIILSIPELNISSVYPNPFKSGLSLSVQTKSIAPITTTVYNLKGQIVYSDKSALPAGENKLQWSGLDANGRQVPSGMYIISVEAEGKRASTKAIKL